MEKISPNRIIEQLESYHFKFGLYFTLFLSAVFVRTTLEVVVGFGRMTTLTALALHYPMFYISILISILLILTTLSGARIQKTFRVLVPFYCIIILPPVIDLLIFGAGGFRPRYQFLTSAQSNILHSFFKFLFSGNINNGITIGMRIEILLAILGISIYVYMKSKSILRTILAAIATYCTFFLYSIAPIFLNIIRNVPIHFGFSRTGNIGWMGFWMLCVIIQLPIVIFISNDKSFFHLLRRARPVGAIQLMVMLFLGLWTGFLGNLHLITEIDFFQILFCALAFLFVWEFFVVLSDIFDNNANVASLPRREFTNRTSSVAQMKWLALLYLLLSLLSASQVSGRITFTVMSLIAISWMYSVPPARLKRIPFLSTAMLAFASLIAAYGGLMLTGRNPVEFPARLAMAIMLAFSLSFNVKDLNSSCTYENTAWTIVTIFGKHTGRLIIAVMTAISYIIFPIVAGVSDAMTLLISLIFGGVAFAIIAKNTNKRYIFFIYLLYCVLLFFPLNSAVRRCLPQNL